MTGMRRRRTCIVPRPTSPPALHRRTNARIETGAPTNASESEFLRAVLAAYPDRVAQRRAGTSDRLKLSSGTGAVLARESGVRTGEFLVAVDVRSRADARGGPTADDGAIVHLASLVEREWLVPNRREAVHRFDESTKSVRASMVESYDALVLSETPMRPDPVIAAELLTGEWKQRESAG